MDWNVISYRRRSRCMNFADNGARCHQGGISWAVELAQAQTLLRRGCSSLRGRPRAPDTAASFGEGPDRCPADGALCAIAR